MSYLVNNRVFVSLEEAKQFCFENNIPEQNIQARKVVLRTYKK
jgi:hypothetical protein